MTFSPFSLVELTNQSVVVPTLIKTKHHSTLVCSPARISRQAKQNIQSEHLLVLLWRWLAHTTLQWGWPPQLSPHPPPAPPDGVYAGQCLYFTVRTGWQVPSRVNRLSLNHKTHWSTMDLIYWRMFSTQSKLSPVSPVSKTTQLPIVVIVATTPPSPLLCPHHHKILCFRLILARPHQRYQPSVRAANLMATSNLWYFTK